VDDPLKDADGKFALFVGIGADQIEAQVGEELGRLVSEAQIDPENIRIASVEHQKPPVCVSRADTA
jgi:hypothetical protein